MGLIENSRYHGCLQSFSMGKKHRRRNPPGYPAIAGRPRVNAGYYPENSLVLLCTGNWLLLIPHVDQGSTAHLAEGNAGSAEDTARLTD